MAFVLQAQRGKRGDSSAASQEGGLAAPRALGAGSSLRLGRGDPSHAEFVAALLTSRRRLCPPAPQCPHHDQRSFLTGQLGQRESSTLSTGPETSTCLEYARHSSHSCLCLSVSRGCCEVRIIISLFKSRVRCHRVK